MLALIVALKVKHGTIIYRLNSNHAGRAGALDFHISTEDLVSFRLRTVSLSQLSLLHERKEIGEKNTRRRAKTVFPFRFQFPRGADYFISPISFHSRDGQSWERGTARSPTFRCFLLTVAIH